MSDCDMGGSAPADDYSCAPDTSTNYSSYVEPQSNYETCVSETTNTTRYSNTTEHSHHCHPISEDAPAEVYSPDHILHDTAFSDPFLDATQESEHRHHSDVPRFSRYNSRSSYKPSYMMNRLNTPRRHVDRDGTHAINSPNKVGNQLSVGDNTELICRIVWAAIGGLIFFVVVLSTTLLYLRDNTTKGSKDGETQERIFSVPDFSTANEDMMNTLRRLNELKPRD